MKRLYLLVPVALAAALAGCALVRTGYAPERITVHEGPAPKGAVPAVGDSIEVMSWNIQYGEDLEQALAEIRAHDHLAGADVVLLQEMNPEGVKFLAGELGLNYVYGPAYVHPHHKELFGNAVLSRWPIVDHRALILPHEGPLSGHRRIAVSADIDLGDRILRAVSVHTATMVMDLEKRLDQAEAVRDSLGPHDGPVILGGDFNTVSDYEVTLLRQTMRRLGLKTVRLPAGPTVVNRFRKLPGSEPVLDHLFVRGLTAGSRGVARDTGASDHYPVWAVFGLPPAPEAESDE